MSSHKLQIEEIVNPKEILLLRSLECPIDNMVPMENSAIVCKKCETVYCKDCIEKWKNTSNICPMRCSPMELIPIERTILAQQIEKIKVKCKNESHGCTEKVLLKDQKTHEKNCLFKQVECCKCKELQCEGYILEHLLNQCKKLTINCFICKTTSQVSEINHHLRQCLDNHYICKICTDYHPSSESNTDSNCKLLLETCKDCKLPELKLNLGTQNHLCLSEKYKDNNIVINNYLLQLLIKIESIIEKKSVEKSKLYLSFKNEIEQIVKLFENKFDSKLFLLEKRKSKIEEESIRKIIIKNQNKAVDLHKIKSDIQQDNSKIDGKYFLINIFKLLGIKQSLKEEQLSYNFNIEKLKREFSFISSKNELKLNQLTNILYNISIIKNNNKSANESGLKLPGVSSVIGGNDELIPKDNQLEGIKKRNTHVREKSDSFGMQTEATNKVIKMNDVLNNNNKILSQKDKSQSNIIDMHKVNKEIESKLENPNNGNKCIICCKPQSIKELLSKCYYSNCKNYFCKDCYARNYFQARGENWKCEFFDCDTCKVKKNCIMSSLFCTQCDKRVCFKCFRGNHAEHNKIKYYD